MHVSGEVYKDFGTIFNTRLLVIDKPEGENPESLRADGDLKPVYQAMQRQRVDTVAEAVPILKEVRDDRRTDVEQECNQQPRQTPTGDGRPGGPGVSQPGRDTQQSVSTRADSVVSQPTGSALLPSEPRDDAGEVERVDVRPDTETGVEVAEPEQETPSDTGDDDTGTRGQGSDRSLEDATVLRDTRDGRSHQEDTETQIDASSTWGPTVDSHIIKGRRVNLMETIFGITTELTFHQLQFVVFKRRTPCQTIQH